MNSPRGQKKGHRPKNRPDFKRRFSKVEPNTWSPECLFEVLLKGVTTLFGLRNVGKSFEKTLRVFGSAYVTCYSRFIRCMRHHAVDDDSVTTCLSKSQDDDSMTMCLSNSQDDVMMRCVSNSQDEGSDHRGKQKKVALSSLGRMQA